jgi:hypothetical protein
MLAFCLGQRAPPGSSTSRTRILRTTAGYVGIEGFNSTTRQIAFAFLHLQQLETDTFTDEDGRAVHENCVVFRSLSHDPGSGLAEILGVLQLNVCAKRLIEHFIGFCLRVLCISHGLSTQMISWHSEHLPKR